VEFSLRSNLHKVIILGAALLEHRPQWMAAGLVADVTIMDVNLSAFALFG